MINLIIMREMAEISRRFSVRQGFERDFRSLFTVGALLFVFRHTQAY